MVYLPVILASGRLRVEDHKSMANLNYMVRTPQKTSYHTNPENASAMISPWKLYANEFSDPGEMEMFLRKKGNLTRFSIK